MKTTPDFDRAPAAARWVGAWTLALASLTFTAQAQAATSFEPTAIVQGTPLVLQGMGTRYRAIFRVYDVALYLPRKVASAEEALQAKGPVRLSFVALRDLPGTDLGRSFIKGLVSNATPEQVNRYTPASNRLIEIFSGRKKLAEGDAFAMEFVPGQGTTFFIQGQAQGAPVGDAEYFQMILRIWLGHSPADAMLKDALLGAPAP